MGFKSCFKGPLPACCRRQGVRAANPHSRLHYTCILSKSGVIPKSAPNLNQPIHTHSHVHTHIHTSTQGSTVTWGRDSLIVRRADANQATARCQMCSAGRCANCHPLSPSLVYHHIPLSTSVSILHGYCSGVPTITLCLPCFQNKILY